MMKKLILLFLIQALVLNGIANRYYVSVKGSNNNNGIGPSADRAWKTIQYAADNLKPGDTCYIMGGIYRETIVPANSGTVSNPITYMAYPGEKVVINGCEKADGGWSKYSGKIFQKTIKLPVNGYNTHITSDTTILANQIFINGKAMVLARWPNLSDPEDLLNYRDNRWDKAAITNGPGKEINMIDSILPGNLLGAIVYFGGWFINRTGTVIASSPGKMTLRVLPRTGTELQAFGKTDPKDWTSFRRYYHIWDKLSLLDTAYEWFYDGNKLYLWAPGGKKPKTIEYKQRNYAFNLNDKSYVTIKGLQIFAATIITNNNSEGITIDGIIASHISHYITMEGNLDPHTRETGIQLMGPNSIIKNSIIRYSAGNGIVLGAAGNIADNNIISDIDYGGTYECAILPAKHPVIITHNTVSRTGRCAITDFKNDIISYNDLSVYGMLSCDMGTIYCANDVNCEGGSIDHNFIHDPASWWGNHGIYTDNSSGNALIHHNVFWGSLMDNFIFRNGGAMPNKIYNNTSVNGNVRTQGATGEDDVRNNLFISWKGAKGTNNLYRGTDPKFVNPSANDYRLQSSSPAIDAGTTVAPYTDGYKGSAPDIGAFENGGPDWTAGAKILRRE